MEQLLAQVMDEDMLSSFTGLGADEEDLEELIMPCTIDIYKDSILPARIYFDMGESSFQWRKISEWISWNVRWN